MTQPRFWKTTSLPSNGPPVPTSEPWNPDAARDSPRGRAGNRHRPRRGRSRATGTVTGWRRLYPRPSAPEATCPDPQRPPGTDTASRGPGPHPLPARRGAPASARRSSPTPPPRSSPSCGVGLHSPRTTWGAAGGGAPSGSGGGRFAGPAGSRDGGEADKKQAGEAWLPLRRNEARQTGEHARGKARWRELPDFWFAQTPWIQKASPPLPLLISAPSPPLPLNSLLGCTHTSRPSAQPFLLNPSFAHFPSNLSPTSVHIPPVTPHSCAPGS